MQKFEEPQFGHHLDIVEHINFHAFYIRCVDDSAI